MHIKFTFIMNTHLIIPIKNIEKEIALCLKLKERLFSLGKYSKKNEGRLQILNYIKSQKQISLNEKDIEVIALKAWTNTKTGEIPHKHFEIGAIAGIKQALKGLI